MKCIIMLHVFYYVVFLCAKYASSLTLVCPPTNYHALNTSFGWVRGCKETLNTENLDSPGQNVNIYSYKGIPYAEPPIGNLRFERTVPKHVSEQPYHAIDATTCGHPCMQAIPLDTVAVMDENCLFLNIFTPTTNSSANLPVMFWIHGGAYLFGSGCELGVYDGSVLASRQVVYVSINYRMGVFANLYGNSSEAPGNAGFWDQAMALNWTRQYISNFGGNPNDITVFGESAGSWSVSYLIVSNVTRNWFNKAIMLSGSSYAPIFYRSPKLNYQLSRDFASNSTVWADRGGVCDNDTTWIKCLKEKSALVLLEASSLSLVYHTPQDSFLELTAPHFIMWGDFHSFMPNSIITAVNNGDFNKDLKLLMGHTDMEAIAFALAASLLQPDLGGQRYDPLVPYVPVLDKKSVYNDIKNTFILNKTIGPIIAEAYTKDFKNNDYLALLSSLIGEKSVIFLLQSIFNTTGIEGIQAFLGNKEDPNAIRKTGAHALGDFALTCPTILFGAYIAQKSGLYGNVFQYRLTYRYLLSVSRESIWSGAGHTDDLLLVFGAPFNPPLSLIFGADDRKVSRIMVETWTKFAKNGAPSNVNNNVWPPYSLKTDGSVNVTYLELNDDDSLLGKVYVDRYRGNDGYFTGINVSAVNNCFEMDKIFKEMDYS